jgi:AcrR family transcriptional regulator
MNYADRIIEVKSQVTDEYLVKQRREQIVTGAVHLFSKQGYFKTTVQDIAKYVGVSPGLIYQYVRDKEDLLLLSILDVLDSYANELPAAMEGIDDPLNQYCAVFDAYCRVVDTRRDATILAYRSTKSLSPERRKAIKQAEMETNQLISGCIGDCIDKGCFRPVDIELATYQLVMYAHAWALKHWQFSRHHDIDSYVEQGLDFSLHALLTERGWQLKKDNDQLSR